MSRTTAEILRVATDNMDDVFVDRDDGTGIVPVLAAGAAALAEVEADIESHIESALPASASGEWLHLIARGLGLNPGVDEADADLRARIAGGVDYGTPAAMAAAANAIIGDDVAVVVDGLQLTLFCDPDPTGTVQYVTDGYCDHLTLLPAFRGFVVLCPEGLTASQENAIAEALNVRRIAGTSGWAVFSDDYLSGAVYGWPGEER